MLKLGQTLRDIVTGFVGIAVSRHEYLNGCVQFSLKAPAKDNKVEEAHWFDAQQLHFVDDGVIGMIVRSAGAETTGGPVQHAPREKYGL